MHSFSIPELLAPAGGPSALHAAVQAGADAVYLGLERFNARRGAENFTLESFREACEYAHLRGVKLYVTLNTVIMESEMGSALECARQAWRAGADAFIVQDIGLAAEMKRCVPEARLHISTQMNTHNLAGVEAAALLGAERITLARELSLPEIAGLADAAAQLGLEIETFAHGALCVCYSGQCLMSSLIGGRSANRGTCAQACRLPYVLRNASNGRELAAPGEHLLSPKDLCTIDLLPELCEAGVASLKIEGRMKSPEYVYAVTKVYRDVLDRIAAAAEQATDGQADATTEDAPSVHEDLHVRATREERQTLAEAFSRGFTTAYLESERGNDIMSFQRPNNRGVPAGRVARVVDDAALIDASLELAAGDVLEVWTGKGHVALTLIDASRDRSGYVRLALNPKNREERAVRQGDRVFRVRSAAAAFADDAIEPRVPVSCEVAMRIGEPLMMRFEALVGKGDAAGNWSAGSREVGSRGETVSVELAGDIVEPARTKAVSADEVREHIDRLGQTPFALVDFAIELDEGVGIGFSAIHKMRAAALEELQEKILEPWTSRRLPKSQARERNAAPRRMEQCTVVAWATNPACARAAKRAGATLIYVPALNYKRETATVAGQLAPAAESAGYPKQSVISLPTIDHDAFDGTREAAVGFDAWEYAASDKPLFVDSLGDLVRAEALGAQPELGPHVPVANSAALEKAVELGATRVWLSPELTLAQIKDLAKEGASIPLGLTVVGSQELMITEHCLLMSQGACNENCAECPRRKNLHVLHDRKDYDFPVVTDLLGRSHLYNSVKLDVAHALPELISAGVRTFMVDTTLMNAEEAAQAVGRVVRALSISQKSGGNTVSKDGSATSGHLFRGVQ